jgi:hypothetical protein
MQGVLNDAKLERCIFDQDPLKLKRQSRQTGCLERGIGPARPPLHFVHPLTLGRQGPPAARPWLLATGPNKRQAISKAGYRCDGYFSGISLTPARAHMGAASGAPSPYDALPAREEAGRTFALDTGMPGGLPAGPWQQPGNSPVST